MIILLHRLFFYSRCVITVIIVAKVTRLWTTTTIDNAHLPTLLEVYISKIAYQNIWQQCNAWLHHHYFLPPTSVIQSNYMSSLSNLLCTIKGMKDIKGTCRDKYKSELELRNILVKIPKYMHLVNWRYIARFTFIHWKLIFAL